MATNPVQVQKILGGMSYPCSKDQILTTLEQRNADPSIRDAISKLPNKEFNSPADLSDALGDVM
jgi:hypothetical protein